jgi:HTH-type transcriptional regulator/antitoxin HigA
MELEADEFAGRVLLTRAFDEPLAHARSKAHVQAIANQARIHPGIIVGRLQHDGHIPYSHLNGLRVRFKFVDDQH